MIGEKALLARLGLFGHLRPPDTFPELLSTHLFERENLCARSGYAIFGGQIICFYDTKACTRTLLVIPHSSQGFDPKGIICTLP